MSVGVNIAPSWNTVYHRRPEYMKACLAHLHPSSVRIPWVDDAPTRAAVRWCVEQGFQVVVIDHAYDSPEVTVEQIAALELELLIEGVNEPDLDGGDHPITPAQHEFAASRQGRLYTRAHELGFTVLSPSAAWRQNDAALMALPHDIASVHRYAPRAPQPEHAIVPAHDRPVWVTEIGWSTYKTWYGSWVISEEQQRDWLLSMKAQLEANGAAEVIVYALEDGFPRNWSTQTNAGPGNKGIYRFDEARTTAWPKLSASALR